MEAIEQLAGSVHGNHDLIHLNRRHVSKPSCDLEAGFAISVPSNVAEGACRRPAV